ARGERDRTRIGPAPGGVPGPSRRTPRVVAARVRIRVGCSRRTCGEPTPGTIAPADRHENVPTGDATLVVTNKAVDEMIFSLDYRNLIRVRRDRDVNAHKPARASDTPAPPTASARPQTSKNPRRRPSAGRPGGYHTVTRSPTR